MCIGKGAFTRRLVMTTHKAGTLPFATAVRARNLVSHRVEGRFRLLTFGEDATRWLATYILPNGEIQTVEDTQ